MKVAIYVEGITEASFIYQLIGEHYQWDWSKVRIECLNLDPVDAADDLRNIGLDTSPDYYLIYDSCSDTAVASDIRNKFRSHKEEGFDKVVGLRDIYGESYIELYGRQLNPQNVAEFIKDIQEPFLELDNSGIIRVRFAVMEIEAWMLALSGVFKKIDQRLDAEGLLSLAGIDINNDPQTTYFHPFSQLEDIFRSIGKNYNKHWREIKTFVFKIKQADFDSLYYSVQCQSFRDFHDAVFN